MLTLLLACGTAPEGPVYALQELGSLPEFSLVDQEGAVVTRETLLGKPMLGDFMFTKCPDICPMLSTRMAAVGAQYGDRLQLLSFSVDPANDTPAALRAYGERFGATYPGWRFLTGDTAAMRAVVVGGFKLLMERVPAADERPETVLHGSRFVLLDAGGVIRAYPDPDVAGEIEGYVNALLAATSGG